METFLIIVVAVLIFLPPKWDPVVQWKMKMEEKRRKKEEFQRMLDGM